MSELQQKVTFFGQRGDTQGKINLEVRWVTCNELRLSAILGLQETQSIHALPGLSTKGGEHDRFAISDWDQATGGEFRKGVGIDVPLKEFPAEICTERAAENNSNWTTENYSTDISE